MNTNKNENERDSVVEDEGGSEFDFSDVRDLADGFGLKRDESLSVGRERSPLNELKWKIHSVGFRMSFNRLQIGLCLEIVHRRNAKVKMVGVIHKLKMKRGSGRSATETKEEEADHHSTTNNNNNKMAPPSCSFFLSSMLLKLPPSLHLWQRIPSLTL